jgi:hypothetical protein
MTRTTTGLNIQKRDSKPVPLAGRTSPNAGGRRCSRQLVGERGGDRPPALRSMLTGTRSPSLPPLHPPGLRPAPGPIPVPVLILDLALHRILLRDVRGHPRLSACGPFVRRLNQPNGMTMLPPPTPQPADRHRLGNLYCRHPLHPRHRLHSRRSLPRRIHIHIRIRIKIYISTPRLSPRARNNGSTHRHTRGHPHRHQDQDEHLSTTGQYRRTAVRRPLKRMARNLRTPYLQLAMSLPMTRPFLRGWLGSLAHHPPPTRDPGMPPGRRLRCRHGIMTIMTSLRSWT